MDDSDTFVDLIDFVVVGVDDSDADLGDLEVVVDVLVDDSDESVDLIDSVVVVDGLGDDSDADLIDLGVEFDDFELGDSLSGNSQTDLPDSC